MRAYPPNYQNTNLVANKGRSVWKFDVLKKFWKIFEKFHLGGAISAPLKLLRSTPVTTPPARGPRGSNEK